MSDIKLVTLNDFEFKVTLKISDSINSAIESLWYDEGAYEEFKFTWTAVIPGYSILFMNSGYHPYLILI